jgi:hypothetical protein
VDISVAEQDLQASHSCFHEMRNTSGEAQAARAVVFQRSSCPEIRSRPVRRGDRKHPGHAVQWRQGLPSSTPKATFLPVRNETVQITSLASGGLKRTSP